MPLSSKARNLEGVHRTDTFSLANVTHRLSPTRRPLSQGNEVVAVIRHNLIARDVVPVDRRGLNYSSFAGALKGASRGLWVLDRGRFRQGPHTLCSPPLRPSGGRRHPLAHVQCTISDAVSWTLGPRGAMTG